MKATSILTTLLPALSALLSAEAHGYVSFFAVDGVAYEGNAPNADTKASPIRQISTIDPVKGSDNKNLMCGQNAQPASMVVDANPGSKITFQWTDGPGNWPHNTGPIVTYMASCGSTTCDKFDPANAKWFKIDQSGKKPNDQSTWVQQDIMNRKSYSTKIPGSLASGQYLIRHEIIALHLGMTMGGAEFYPSCMQVNIGGSQVSTASANELVSFPGAYSDSDPGIYVPNVYDPSSSYTFPGPAVASMATSDLASDSTGDEITSAGGTPNPVSDSGSSSSVAVPPSSSSPTSSRPSSTPVPTSTSTGVTSGSSGSCRLKKRNLLKRGKTTPAETKVSGPRHFSRVLAKFIRGGTW